MKQTFDHCQKIFIRFQKYINGMCKEFAVVNHLLQETYAFIQSICSPEIPLICYYS